MRTIAINIKNIKTKLRFEIILVPLLFIIVIFTIPYFLPYDSDWNPPRSINNKGSYGHSELQNALQDNYNVRRQYKDITKLNLQENSLLVIISPEIKFTSKEIQFLKILNNYGISILILGTSSGVDYLISNWGFSINTRLGNIYDFTNNVGNDPSLPIISDNDNNYMSVIPSSINYNDNYYIAENYELITNTGSESSDCITSGSASCNSSYLVGIGDKSNQIAFIADNWMLSNKFVNLYPTNKDLIQNIIDYINPQIKSIIFDESHYKWAPLNKAGVEVFFNILINNFSEQFNRFRSIGSFILLLSFLLPFAIASSSGILSDITSQRKDKSLAKKIGKRINTLYLDNVPAVPLTLEERFLIEEQLKLKEMGSNYFQYLANNHFTYLTDEDLIDYMPNFLIEGLEIMMNHPLPKNQAWDLIAKINNGIKHAQELKELKKLETTNMEEFQ